MKFFQRGFLWGYLVGWTLAFMVAACLPKPAPAPPPQPTEDPSTCAGACQNLALLRCPGWDGSPGPDDQMGTADDVPCVQACGDILLSEPTVELYLTCQAGAASCEAAYRCFE